MHIDWRWIKQRPQFLAEELAKYYKVSLLFQHRYGKDGFQQTAKNKEIKYCPVYVIPRGDRNPILRKVNRYILKLVISFWSLLIRPEIIYVCSPKYCDCIKRNKNTIIVYDCMDDHVALASDNKIEVLEQEEKLINQCDFVLASSQYLIDKVLPYRGAPRYKCKLIRNGFSGTKAQTSTIVSQKKQSNNVFNLCYIGTIGSWFDFETIGKCLEQCENVVVHLIGPADSSVKQRYQSERLIFHGTIEHGQLQSMIEKYDCLIMPFLVNDVVKAVDPVKLYEYIDFGKNIISCKYEEIERFSPFVFFYENAHEFVEIVNSLKEDNRRKYSNTERDLFLTNNTWAERARVISEMLGV